ncbi:hypothetical protein C0992_010544 [Termitomyces sp. T32_za158]|nr:hypothetical protein C0992_010544 [Termitomyces sp. T32_za158]
MPELLLNPNEAVRPNFASDDYTAARNALIGGNVDEQAAIAMLENVWNANNAAEKEIWARQRREDGEAEREREIREREAREHREDARAMEEESMRIEERKKHKSKYTEIAMNPPADTPPEILPAYATSRLQKGMYVEMWYFTNEGLDYALKSASAIDDDALVQSVDRDGNAVWTTAATSKGSRSALDDRDLTWEQLSIAIPRFLDAIHAAGWTEQRQAMMAELFTRLQAHPYRASRDHLDRKALLKYLSEQRRLWHQAIEAGTGAWNIGVLNENLLRMAADSVRREHSDRNDAERARICEYNKSLSERPR